MTKQKSDHVEVLCASLTKEQKKEINDIYGLVKILLRKLGDYNEAWEDLPYEKLLTTMGENELCIQLDEKMCEDFQLCLNPQQTGIDAVGIAHTVQLKVLGGITENSKMFKVSGKKGGQKKICDYVKEMERVSNGKKALFSFYNRKEKKIQVFDSALVKDIQTTYLKWDSKVRPIREMGFSMDYVEELTSLLKN